MQRQRKNSDEMRDQLTLLLLLYKLKERGFKTQRLKLQKLVYLADIFGTILEKKPTSYIFTVYKLGPFSKDIQGDVERLVALGDTKAEEAQNWDPNFERSFEYEINPSGATKAEMFQEIPEYMLTDRAIELAVEIGGHLTGSGIKKLVYSEPNYLEAKSNGFETIISPEYKFAVKFREIANKISAQECGLKLNEREIAWMYLNFVKSMQQQGK